MRGSWLTIVALVLASSACIAPSVVSSGDRAVELTSEKLEWRAGSEADLPGVFVSTQLTGQLAAALRKVVYLFVEDGSYTGAGLIDDAPPHFEVITGRWEMDASGLRLDGGPPATVEVAPDGSLRLTGDEGSVVLRRERGE